MHQTLVIKTIKHLRNEANTFVNTIAPKNLGVLNVKTRKNLNVSIYHSQKS